MNDAERQLVLEVVDAVTHDDLDLLRRCLDQWNSYSHQALLLWASETFSGIHREFQKVQLGDPRLGRDILQADTSIRSVGEASPITTAWAILPPIMLKLKQNSKM